LKEKLEAQLIELEQQHLVEELSSFSESECLSLKKDLENISWSDLKSVAAKTEPKSIKPSRVISLEEQEKRAEELKTEGIKAYTEEDVAVLMVAGGQGTRLGFDGPKGCYKIGAISKKTVYQIQAEKVLALSRILKKEIPFLVMTSPATDKPTRDFFTEHKNFGLSDKQLRFFSQGTVPSLTEEGKLLLSAPGQLLKNPDGHGGCFTALCNSGLLEELRGEGIEHLIYIQVDNILAPVYDPVMLGLAKLEKADVITKVVEKTRPEEKVGLLVQIDGVDGIVEYISMTEEQLSAKDDSGKLKFRSGNTAMHYWNVSFLLKKFDEGYSLPLHRSKKPLKAFSKGKTEEVEGYKHERFIFDLLPSAKVSLGLEVRRENEFAPLKNASGVDSAETVHKLCSDMFKSWIQAAGGVVSASCTIEISPLFALAEEQFKLDLNTRETNTDTYLS